MHCSPLIFQMPKSYWPGHSPPMGCVPTSLTSKIFINWPTTWCKDYSCPTNHLGCAFLARWGVDSPAPKFYLTACFLSHLTADSVSSCSLDIDAKIELEVQGIFKGRHLWRVKHSESRSRNTFVWLCQSETCERIGENGGKGRKSQRLNAALRKKILAAR